MISKYNGIYPDLYSRKVGKKVDLVDWVGQQNDEFS